MSSVRLDKMSKLDKSLTVKVTLKDLAEFSVATELLGQRTNSASVHQFMMQKVREAKESIEPEIFQEKVKEKTEEIKKRSSEKSKTSPLNKKKEAKPQLTKAIVPANETLNFSGNPKKSKKSREEQLNAELDAIIEEKEKGE